MSKKTPTDAQSKPNQQSPHIDHKIKEAELELKREEFKAKLEAEKRNIWFSSPLVVGISSAIFAILGTGAGAALQGYWNTQLERQKFESALIQKALENTKKEDAAINLKFLVDAGLIQSLDKDRIAELARTPANLPTIETASAQQTQIVSDPVTNDGCRNPPVSAILNYWPITYSQPAQSCHDYPPVDARFVNGGVYSKTQEEWEAGRTARTGDELYVLVWINNGAADNAEQIVRGLGIARNIKLQTETDVQVGPVHYIKVRFFGDNTNIVTSKIKITTGDKERLEVIPQSGEVYDYSGTKALRSNLDIGNNTFIVGDLKPRFQDGVFVRYRVKVVS